MSDSALVREAYKEALLGLAEGGLPIGSVLVDQGGQVVARGHNLRVQTGDPTAHAEVVAIRYSHVHLSISGTVMYICLYQVQS